MGDLKFNEVHPVLKWVGGKTQLLSDIRLKYPQGVDRFCEPMVGAGAVISCNIYAQTTNLAI